MTVVKGVNSMGRTIYDDDTGEQIDHLEDGDRILRKTSIDKIKELHEDELPEGTATIKQFFKGNGREISLILPELDVYEKAFLFSVAPYVNYMDCCLKYSNGKDVTADGLLCITGIKRSKMFMVVDSLVKKDIIYKGVNSKNKQYYVNPWLFCKGNRLNKVLKNMFRNYRIRSMNGMKWGNMSD